MTSQNRNYHGWTNIEDDKLVEALLNMINIGGFKADNGFKPGYLQHLEQALKESLPNSGILGKPHIESRIKTMKKDWQAVYDMLNDCSGFGYCKELNCVTTNAPGVWESYIENHKWAAKWRNKKLPHYDELCAIFGNNRAQGNRAKVVLEMEDDVSLEEVQEGNHAESDDDVVEATEGNQNVSSRKRKNTSQVNPLVEGFTTAVTSLGDRLKESSAEISEGIKLEVDMKKKTSMITFELSKMTSFSQRWWDGRCICTMTFCISSIDIHGIVNIYVVKTW